jgi:hypothetical protein
MRMRSLALPLTTTALGAAPGLAQNVDQVKPVFEHVLPNANGKRLVAPYFREGNWISPQKMKSSRHG